MFEKALKQCIGFRDANHAPPPKKPEASPHLKPVSTSHTKAPTHAPAAAAEDDKRRVAMAHAPVHLKRYGRGWRVAGGVAQIPFTHFALILAMAGLALGAHSNARAVATCMLCGCATSFYLTPLLDANAYARLAQANGWTMAQFHAGNAVLHAIPAIASCVYPPTRMCPAHGTTAIALHGAWARTCRAARCAWTTHTCRWRERTGTPCGSSRLRRSR